MELLLHRGPNNTMMLYKMNIRPYRRAPRAILFSSRSAGRRQEEVGLYWGPTTKQQPSGVLKKNLMQYDYSKSSNADTPMHESDRASARTTL